MRLPKIGGFSYSGLLSAALTSRLHHAFESDRPSALSFALVGRRHERKYLQRFRLAYRCLAVRQCRPVRCYNRTGIVRGILERENCRRIRTAKGDGGLGPR